MSNQQNPHDEFGGFGESDDQTFLHDKSKLSSESESASSPEKGKSKESGSGFISYVQPDVPPEDQFPVKKMALIAIATVSALAIIWMITSKDGTEVNPEQTSTVDTVTVAELNEEEARKQAQATTMEQDSIAQVQDYLARMQMSQGQNIGNNERDDEITEVAKAPEKKVVPPDPIPAKTYPEYREVEDVKQTESIQKDKPIQPKIRVLTPAPEIKKKQVKAIAQKIVKKEPEKKKSENNNSKIQSEKDQVRSETFLDKEPVKKNQETKNQVKNTSGEEYSVQVLSSISKQEADKALKNLQSKGISSALVTKKSLNGKTWYRVRFGSFEDRKQAQTAAKKVGYSNSWVDRVK